MSRFLIAPNLDQPLTERVQPWKCGRCGKRILDVNYSLPSELVHKCPNCKADVYNVLRIVVVVQEAS